MDATGHEPKFWSNAQAYSMAAICLILGVVVGYLVHAPAVASSNPPAVAVAPPPPKGFQVLTAPINIPDKIPDIDLSKAVTDEKDFSGKGVAGGKANGVVGGVPTNSR